MKRSRYDRVMRWILWIAAILVFLALLTWNRRPYGGDWQIGDGPRVGLVKIEGVILDGERVVRQLDTFGRRKDIRAILVRIDSPGGTVAASQEIYAKIRKLREKGDKPVIASLGTVAASGGYYVAVAADTVMANPGTTTGSIGVILDYPVASELLGKLGIRMEVVKSGPLKDAGSPFRPSSEADRRSFQGVVDDLHDQFTEVVAEERGLSLERVRELATGEVFTGRQAVELGLVDLLGDFEDAVVLAGALTGAEKRPVIVRPPERRRMTLWQLLFGELWPPGLSAGLLPQYLMR